MSVFGFGRANVFKVVLVAAAALLAACLLALVGMEKPAGATFPGGNGKIAFSTVRGVGQNVEVYAMNADGTNQTNLTNNAADPINSKKAITFTVSCGGENFEVVEPFGAGGALHVLGDTTNIVVKEITFTALDPDTGEVLDTVTYATGAKVGLEDELVNCTREPFEATDPELGEIEILAEGRVLFTPRGT